MLSNYFCSNHAWVSYIGFTEAYNDATENVSPMSEINIPKSPGEYITLSARYRLQFAIVCSYFVTFIYSYLYVCNFQTHHAYCWTVELHQVHLLCTNSKKNVATVTCNGASWERRKKQLTI